MVILSGSQNKGYIRFGCMHYEKTRNNSIAPPGPEAMPIQVEVRLYS